MIDLHDLIKYITEILVPIAMISGIGIIALLTQTRYGRVVDITRKLNTEKLTLFQFKVTKSSRTIKVETNIIEKRLKNIDKQIFLFLKRGIYLKRALTALLTGIFLFISTSLLILLQESVPLILITPIIALSFIAGMALLVTGGMFILVDLHFSHKAVIMAVEGTNKIIQSFEKS